MLNSDLPNINSIGNGSEAQAVIAKLIGYVETPDLAAAQAAMAATDVNARWQSQMGELFEDLDLPPDQGFLRLNEIFNLDAQLTAAGLPTAVQGE